MWTGVVECFGQGKVKGKSIPDGRRLRIFGSSGDTTTVKRTPSVAPLLNALSELHKMNPISQSAIWGPLHHYPCSQPFGPFVNFGRFHCLE